MLMWAVRPGSWLRSLRLRLLVGTLLWIAVTVIVAGWGLSHLFQQHIQQQLESELKLHTNQLTSLLNVDETGKVTLTAPLSDPRFQVPFSGLYWQVDRLADDYIDGQTGVLRSRSLWDSTLTLSAIDAESATVFDAIGPDGENILVLARVIQPAEEAAAPLRLLLAAEQSLIAEPVGRFTRILILSLALLAAGLMLAAVVQVVTGLRPLGQLRRQLTAVRDGSSPRIDGRFPTEVQPLVDEFNGVLAMNAQVVTHAQTQAGNLAHAVKTPLSILANAAEHQDNDFGRLVLEQLAMARRQVDHHLLRARAAAAVQATGLRTPVRPPLEALVRVMSRLHADAQLDISLDIEDDGLAFRGEEHDLQEMMGNLLDNACKWASHRIVVKVSSLPPEAGKDNKWLSLNVDDDGRGLAPEQREQVFKRGVRADEQAPGSGLGLSIVRDLAQLYGGDAMAYTSPLGGLGVALRLPAA